MPSKNFTRLIKECLPKKEEAHAFYLIGFTNTFRPFPDSALVPELRVRGYL